MRLSNKRLFAGLALSSMLILSACGTEAATTTEAEVDLNALTLGEIETQAQEEGHVESVGMPDTWANWGETWEELDTTYGLTHADTDMSSAEELALFKAEQNNPTKDIGDVGQSFGPVAEEDGLTLAYKTSYWDDIPEWAKDDDGDWIVGYYGTLSFITNSEKVTDAPTSFADILAGDYKVTVGDVNAATQAQNAVLAAAIANGGDETNLDPGIAFFAQLAEQGRLDLGDTSLARLESGEIEVGLFWDFNALNYANQVAETNPNASFEVTIPQDGTIQSGYATVINATAPNPHAAALAREYILSDEGQINLAKGYARPIRDNVELPQEVQDILLPAEQYVKAQPVSDFDAWEEAAAGLGQRWQEEVLTKVK
ncbi:putative spermidine/putrescine transport system substrate-binding protein [Trichococcus patagoniensis]|uniref:Putative spermidine/putrescine transport system substrate-binding protein n=1 Tax=Trichococcus patagoniensis TaxID=382641 RepID=A0A2T5IBP9_9LACT|nr:extracellular solute-binding protein [Trichococcus patagoniensis]PTQ81259.1 putative spermidine/putrescine transport system substrate-binding protein [Trichococcus patagoniensis]